MAAYYIAQICREKYIDTLNLMRKKVRLMLT